MKAIKISINPIYRDLFIVFMVSLGTAVAMVSAAVVLFG
jgi:hypothetical protein